MAPEIEASFLDKMPITKKKGRNQDIMDALMEWA
jgi:hypothetical protein